MNTLNINSSLSEEIIDTLQEYNDFSYDMESSIEESKLILEEEIKVHSLSECHYEQEKWHFETNDSTTVSVDFSKIQELIRFNKELKPSFIDIVKCWTASLIENMSALYVEQTFRYLRQFLEITKGFTIHNEEEIYEEIKYLPFNTRRNLVIALLNFFDFYPGNESAIYLPILNNLKLNRKKDNSRLLPPSKDILIFSKIVEHYFSTNLSENEYLKWFPIWLWWNLTNLIPMRPCEFCIIDRNCLLIKDGKHFIKLPRRKQRKIKGRQIQIESELYIPETLYRKIEDYIQRTEYFGNTDTLISYSSIPKIHYGEFRHIYKRKRNTEKFSLLVFRPLLKLFYEKIVFDKYEIVLSKSNVESVNLLSISQKVQPGDTRHLAFINLKRQGYHPVEIAKIGGHSTLYAQEHYFNHISKFVDLEILELITNANFNMSDQQGNQENSIGTDFIDRFIIRPPTTETKIKMKDGYCTDAKQRCKVEDCWECDSWRISEEEFSSKSHILEEKLAKASSDLSEVIDNIKSLYQSIYANIKSDDFYSDANPEIKKQLIDRSKRIDDLIRKHVNLIKVKERIEHIGKTRSESKDLSTKRN